MTQPRCGPDEQESATAKFQLLNEANATLKDITKKIQYDQWLGSGNKGAYDSSNQEFDIPWVTGPGWGPRFRNALLVLTLILGVGLIACKEGSTRWRSAVAHYMKDATDMLHVKDSTLLKMGLFETVLFLLALWYYNVGEDYYTRWVLFVVTGFLSLDCMARLKEPADEEGNDTFRLDSAFFFGLFSLWYGYQSLGLISSFGWSAFISFVVTQIIESQYDTSKLDGENAWGIAFICASCFAVWLLQEVFWLRCIVAVFHVYKILTFLKSKSELAKEGDEALREGELWMLINAGKKGGVIATAAFDTFTRFVCSC